MKNKFKIIDASSGEKLKLGERKANELFQSGIHLLVLDKTFHVKMLAIQKILA